MSEFLETAEQLAALHNEPLHPDLQPYVEEGTFGTMLRHPLVYSVPLILPGQANIAYERKRELLADAAAEYDWPTVIWLHERAYRLEALIDWVTGRDEDGRPVTLGEWAPQEVLDLVADVWVDTENIEQMMDEWRAIFGNGTGFFLGNEEERAQFAALPEQITAYRAGIDDGDWSWTTDRRIAEFFAQRFQKPGEVPITERLIPKALCFGYLTRRGESELLVRAAP